MIAAEIIGSGGRGPGAGQGRPRLHLGSCKKMDVETARQKARKMKAAALANATLTYKSNLP